MCFHIFVGKEGASYFHKSAVISKKLVIKLFCSGGAAVRSSFTVVCVSCYCSDAKNSCMDAWAAAIFHFIRRG